MLFLIKHWAQSTFAPTQDTVKEFTICDLLIYINSLSPLLKKKKKKKIKSCLLLIVSIYVAPFPLKNFIDCASSSFYFVRKIHQAKVQMCLIGYHWITGGSKIDDICIKLNGYIERGGYNSGSNSVLS